MLKVYCAQFSNTRTIRIPSQADRQTAGRDCDGVNYEGVTREYFNT